MSFQEEQYYKIEAYLSGELDAEELKAFEDEISTDNLLKAELEKHKVANALIMQQRLLSVKNILQEERIKDSNSGTSFKPFGFILVAVAAIGIGTSVWILNKKDVQTSTLQKQNSISERASTAIDSVDKKTSVGESASKQNQHNTTSSSDNGFHKHQIQQVEEHIRVDEKGTLHVDSSFIGKKYESNTVSSNAQAPTVQSNVPVDTDPCTNVSIQATVKVTPSCSHEATGNILVHSIQGGTKPYSIVVSSSNNESVVNGELPKGMYQAIVADAKGCTHIYSNIVVAAKECSIDYSFNPFIGEKWLIESYKAAGQVEIYNKGGVLYYKENIEANNSNEWTGIGFNNQILSGYYIFVIKYVDGTMRKGSVTIVQ